MEVDDTETAAWLRMAIVAQEQQLDAEVADQTASTPITRLRLGAAVERLRLIRARLVELSLRDGREP